ncbi:MAG: CBS domain-containing protein [Candidatus Aenigmarchaeota archaeon]|nr:CBS domain-containing protein [Candidatus Aenigmarchaeota archaeon]
MKVRDVMTRDLITIRNDNKVKHALEALAKNKISCCPVLDRKNNFLGIITQTDIIKIIDVHSKIHKAKEMFPLIAAAARSKNYDKLRREIKSVMDMEVSNFMNREPVTIAAHEDLYTAAKVMNKHGINHLPVVNKNKLVGILSKSDLIKTLEKL